MGMGSYRTKVSLAARTSTEICADTLSANGTLIRANNINFIGRRLSCPERNRQGKSGRNRNFGVLRLDAALFARGLTRARAARPAALQRERCQATALHERVGPPTMAPF